MDRFRMLPDYRYYDSTDGIITTAYEKPLRDYKIYGNSIQDSTPSPDNPIEIQSVGDYDEETGKYKIEIEVCGENERSEIYNIFLDEPLRKVGDYVDYIDFKNSKVVRNTAIGHITTASFIHSKVKPNAGNHCCMTTNCMTTNKKVDSLIRNTPMLSVSFPNAENRWSSKIESIFTHISLDGYLYLKVNWDRLGLVYDTSVVYVAGDEAQTALADKEIVSYFTQYLDTLSEKEKEFICVGKPIEEAIELPQPLLSKGTNIIKVKTTTQPSAVSYQYYA